VKIWQWLRMQLLGMEIVGLNSSKCLNIYLSVVATKIVKLGKGEQNGYSAGVPQYPSSTQR